MDAAELTEQLRVVVGAALGEPVGVEGVARLPGGASRETWSFSVRTPTGVSSRYVLRRDPPGAPVSGLRLEAALLEAAARAHVPVPRVLAAGDGVNGIGAAYMIMEFVEGETIPRRILRDERLADVRPVLADQCGRVLPSIASLRPRLPAWRAATRSSSCAGCSTAWAKPIPPSSWDCGGWPRLARP